MGMHYTHRSDQNSVQCGYARVLRMEWHNKPFAAVIAIQYSDKIDKLLCLLRFGPIPVWVSFHIVFIVLFCFAVALFGAAMCSTVFYPFLFIARMN